METQVLQRGPVTDYIGEGLARCVCVHRKEWPEGDYYESAGGKACEECSTASLAWMKEHEQ